MNDESRKKGHETDSDDDSAVAFASMDFSGVNFDSQPDDEKNVSSQLDSSDSELVLEWERSIAFHEFSQFEADGKDESSTPLPGARIRRLGALLAQGRYADILRDAVAQEFFADGDEEMESTDKVANSIRRRVFAKAADSIESCIEIQLLGVASLQLFMQSNYTGPTLDTGEEDSDIDKLRGINPHHCFLEKLSAEPGDGQSRAVGVEDSKESEKSLTNTKRHTQFQNAVLAELAVDGEWPCQVCSTPYFLLVARSILLALADPTRSDWTTPEGSVVNSDESCIQPPPAMVAYAERLLGAQIWCGRAIVAHERLLQARAPSRTLWVQAESVFSRAIKAFCEEDEEIVCQRAATVMLEWGLAEHHFDRPGNGKKSFLRAQKLSGLVIEVTGARGKRTKFQQEATAQYLVRARSSAINVDGESLHANDRTNEMAREQLVEHGDDGILLERIKFEDDKENEVSDLTVLDQSIVLALCLDVKNNNPTDGLTAEEMGAYLARVLDHHDDWMVYSTALLERSWLEFERSHAMERAILQLQALADQHTERLTITQSTRESIENSAPAQDRLKMINGIVYPPRWSLVQDLADRYAKLGIVTSAAELYTSVEMWDDVVSCYKRAGKVQIAEKIVRERLDVQETPRMRAALGDLTNNPEHYQRAIELSKGRFSEAYISLGAYYFDKNELEEAAQNYKMALKVRPLAPHTWFRFGTISMRLKRWDDALAAFSEVVMQEPEEAEAWANIAAVHMHNKQPSEAYPALVESLRRNRNNWRIWVSKLYTCLDLEKYDEAVQAVNTILDLKLSSDNVPRIEEKCVRGIVGGALSSYRERNGDEPSRRTLSRVFQLMSRLSSSSDAEPWVFETMAFLHDNVGRDELVLDDLMKEYRALQSIDGWEKDNQIVRKVCGVVSNVIEIHKKDGNRQSLTKAKFLARGVVKQIHTSRPDDLSLPEEVQGLENSLLAVENAIKNTST